MVALVVVGIVAAVRRTDQVDVGVPGRRFDRRPDTQQQLNVGGLVHHHAAYGPAVAGTGRRGHGHDLRVGAIREAECHAIPARPVSLVRLLHLHRTNLAARRDLLQQPLRQGLQEDPPAAHVVDRLILTLPEQQARRPRHRQRFGHIHREVDPGVADLAALQIDTPLLREGAVDDVPLPPPRLIPSAELVPLQPDLAVLERVADVLEVEPCAVALVDGPHHRHEVGDVFVAEDSPADEFPSREFGLRVQNSRTVKLRFSTFAVPPVIARIPRSNQSAVPIVKPVATPEIENGSFSLAAPEMATTGLPIWVPVTAAPLTGAVPVPYSATTFVPSPAVVLKASPVTISTTRPVDFGVYATAHPIITLVVDVVAAGSDGCVEAPVVSDGTPDDFRFPVE